MPRARFDADPSDRAAFELLEEELFLAADWTRLVPLYEAHLAASAEKRPPADRARLLFRMGQSIEEGFQDPTRAMDAYRAALELDPQFAPALRRLRAVCLASGNFGEAIDAVVREAHLAPSAGTASALAEIGDRALAAADASAAIVSFEAALALTPDAPHALLGLARAYESAGRLNQAVEAWERATERCIGADRSVAIRALGEVLIGALGDGERALQHFQRACEEEPQNAEWLDALFAVLLKLERFEAAAALGSRRIESSADSARRATVAIEIGRIHLDRLAAPAEARGWFTRAVEWCNDGTAHLAIAEAAARLGDDGDCAYHLERAMELGAEIPAWSNRGFGDPNETAASLDTLRQIAASRPDDADALESLAAALGESGHHAERIEVLERRAALAATEAAERAELWLEIGEIHDRQRGDAAAAAQAYRLAIDADPERALGEDALETVLRRAGRLDELGAALAGAIEAAAPARRAAMLCRLGAIDLERADAASALERFALALRADPKSERARSGLLRAAEATGDDKTLFDLYAREATRCDLDRLAELGREALRRSATSDDPDAAVLVVQRWAERSGSRESQEALVALFEETGRTEELVGALEQLETRLDGGERAANRRRLGYLHAAEGRLEDAIGAWREALRHDAGDLASLEALAEALAESQRDTELLALCDAHGSDGLLAPHVELLRAGALERAGRVPEAALRYRALHAAGVVDDESLAGLERTARALDDIEGLVVALSERAARAADPSDRDRWSLEAAQLLDVPLDRSGDALRAFAELEERAADASIRAQAMQRVDALLERGDRFAQLVERLEARVATSPPAAAFAIHERLADLFEGTLRDPDRARRHLEAAVAVDPEHAMAWRRLAALCDEAADAPARSAALEGELRTHPSNERALALHLQIAAIASERLGDDARAQAHWRAALAIDPTQPEANAQLADRLQRSEQWSELAALLGRRIDATPAATPEARTEQRLRLSAALAREPARVAEALAPLEAAIDEMGAIASLAEPAAALLEQLGRSEQLAALCTRAAERAEAPAESAAWWTRAGGVFDRIGDDARAADCHQRAVALDAGADAARTALLATLRRRGDGPALAAALEDAVMRAGFDSVEARVEAAALLEAQQQPERACQHWMRATQLAPCDAALRERALTSAIGAGRDQEAATLMHAAASDPRSSDRAGLWRRCGELRAASQPEAAVLAWRESLAIEPAQPEVRRARRLLLESLGRVDEALAELALEIGTVGPGDRAELAAHGADLAAARHGAAAAAPWLTRLEAEPLDDAALWIGIARLRGQAGAVDAQQRALGCAARLTTDRACSAALHRERAALCEGDPATRGHALAALEAARAQDPSHPDVLERLDRHYTQAGRFRDLLGVLEARLARARSFEIGGLQQRVAICAEALGEASSAAAAWRGAVSAFADDASRRIAVLSRAVDAQRRGRCVESFVELAEQELQHASGARRAELLRELARVLRDELAQPERALAHLRALVGEAAGDSQDRAALIATLRKHCAGGELALQIAERLRTAPGDADGWRELAQLREESLCDPAGAADAWRKLAEIEPHSRLALAGLRRIAERLGDASELARVLEREIAIGANDPAGSWRRLARVRLDELGDVRGAESAFAAARDADPDDLESLRALARLAEAREDWRAAIAHYTEEIHHLGERDAERSRALWLRIADRAAGPGSDLARAADAFERADVLRPLEPSLLSAWAGVVREAGSEDRWRSVFAAFCDHPESSAVAADHLALAESLAQCGARDESAQRLAIVFASDPGNTSAWVLAAQLREAVSDDEGATAAWTRAAESSSGLDAARAYRAAALPWELTDPERAHGLLSLATEAFPSFAAAHAALAVASARIGRHESAMRAASTALRCDPGAAELTQDERLAAALAGTRSAYALARWPAAWDLSGEVLALAPESADGWLAHGVAAFHQGSPAVCSRELETWLATGPGESQRPLPLTVLANALAAQGDAAGALARFDEALAIDATLDDAHAGRSALLEQQGDFARAAVAFADWAQHTTQDAARADRFVRAARLGRRFSGAALPVEAWLCAALDSEPAHATAWLELTEWLAEAGRSDDSFRAASEGAACVDVPPIAAALELRRARTLEERGDESGACRSYLRAAKLDGEAAEAAFAAARLLRRSGAWCEAADCLGDFANRHRNATVRAELLFERARLLAGPLEDVAGALDAYREARELAPERLEVREALGALLAQLPESRDEAKAELGAVLRADPLRTTALRRMARLHHACGATRDADRGMALLRALGASSATEREAAPETLGFPIGADFLDEKTDEMLRQAILEIADEWAAALPQAEEASSPTGGLDASVAPLESAWFAARRALGGPALALLSPDAFARCAEALVGLALGTASSLVASRDALAVAERVSGRAIRKLRRALGDFGPEALRRFDFDAWTAAMLGLALARATDRSEGDLRAALLCAQLAESPPGTPPASAETDLVPWIAGSTLARDVVRRAVRAWVAAR